jgi:hypothetical protein
MKGKNKEKIHIPNLKTKQIKGKTHGIKGLFTP